MSRGPRALLLLAVCTTVGCPGCPSVPRRPTPVTGPVDIEPRSAPRPTFGRDDSAEPTATERGLFAAFSAGRSAAGLRAAQYDPVLGDVAQAHARLFLRYGGPIANAASEHLLAWAGATDPHPQYNVLDARHVSEDDLLRHAERLGAEPSPAEQGWTVVGAGRASDGPRTVLVVLVSGRIAEISPLPRRHEPGEAVTLDVRLHPDFTGATTLYMRPRGGVREAPQASPGDGGLLRFAFDLPDEPGEVLVEVLADGARGPSVGALFPLAVGRDAPRSFSVVAPPDEGDVRLPEQAAARILERIQRDREARGLAPLTSDDRARAAAIAHAREAADSGVLSHVDAAGRSPADRLRAAGVAAARVTENLARNTSLADAHADLMRSLGHRQNILDPEVTHVGVGVHIVEGTGDGREFVVVCNFFRRVPRLDPARDRVALRRTVNERRAERGLGLLRAEPSLDDVASRLANDVLATRDVGGEGLAPPVQAVLARSPGRWAWWAVQAYLVALPLEEAVDGAAVEEARATHVGVGLAQGPPGAGDPRTAVVLVLADER